MPDTIETARLILESSTKGFPEAIQQISDLEMKLAAVKAQYQSGAIDIDAYFEAGGRLQGQLDGLRGALAVAEGALKRHGDAAKAATALGASATSTRNFGMAALEASRAVEDLQFGFMGVVNNIPSLVTSLGGTAGVTAAISLLAVGVNQLINHWDDLIALFQTRNPFPPATDSVAGLKKELEKANDQMKELEKQTSLTDDQLEKYNALRRRAAEAEAEIAAQAERRRQIEEGMKEATPEQEERAQRFREQTQGHYLENFQELYQAIVEEGRREQALGGPARSTAEMAREATTLLNEARRGQAEAIGRVGYLAGPQGPVGMTGLGRQLAAPTAAERREAQAAEEKAQKEAEDRLTEQLHNQDVIEKDLSKTTEDARKEAEKRQKEAADKAAAAERRRLATLAKRVGGGTLGEEAQDYAARLQERQPGISDADLRAAVQAAVAREVARRAPQLAPAEQAGVVSSVTEQALAAPPEDVAARQERQARAAPRAQQAELAQQYTGVAQAQGFNPQAAAEIGRRASAAFARTGDLEGSFMEAIAGFQQVLMGMQQHQQRMAAGLMRVQQGNAALRARQPTAQWEGGFH